MHSGGVNDIILFNYKYMNNMDNQFFFDINYDTAEWEMPSAVSDTWKTISTTDMPTVPKPKAETNPVFQELQKETTIWNLLDKIYWFDGLTKSFMNTVSDVFLWDTKDVMEEWRQAITKFGTDIQNFKDGKTENMRSLPWRIFNQLEKRSTKLDEIFTAIDNVENKRLKENPTSPARWSIPLKTAATAFNGFTATIRWAEEIFMSAIDMITPDSIDIPTVTALEEIAKSPTWQKVWEEILKFSKDWETAKNASEWNKIIFWFIEEMLWPLEFLSWEMVYKKFWEKLLNKTYDEIKNMSDEDIMKLYVEETQDKLKDVAENEAFEINQIREQRKSEITWKPPSWFVDWIEMNEPTFYEEMAWVDWWIFTALQKVDTPTFDKYISQAYKANKDYEVNTPYELVWEVAQWVLDDIQLKKQRIGREKQSLLTQYSDVIVNTQTMKSNLDNLLLDYNLEIVEIDEWVFKVQWIPWKEIWLDRANIADAQKFIDELWPYFMSWTDRNAWDIDMLIDRMQSMLNYNQIDKWKATPLEQRLAWLVGSFNAQLKDVLPEEYRKLNAEYANLIQLQFDLSKSLWPDNLKWWALAKTLFSPQTWERARDLFARIKEEFGVDLANEAAVAKFAMQVSWDTRQANLLEAINLWTWYAENIKQHWLQYIGEKFRESIFDTEWLGREVTRNFYMFDSIENLPTDVTKITDKELTNTSRNIYHGITQYSDITDIEKKVDILEIIRDTVATQWQWLFNNIEWLVKRIETETGLDLNYKTTSTGNKVDIDVTQKKNNEEIIREKLDNAKTPEEREAVIATMTPDQQNLFRTLDELWDTPDDAQIDIASEKIYNSISNDVPVAKKATVIESIKEFIKTWGKEAFYKLWELFDDIADKIGARQKFIDDTQSKFAYTPVVAWSKTKDVNPYKEWLTVYDELDWKTQISKQHLQNYVNRQWISEREKTMVLDTLAEFENQPWKKIRADDFMNSLENKTTRLTSERLVGSDGKWHSYWQNQTMEDIWQQLDDSFQYEERVYEFEDFATNGSSHYWDYENYFWHSRNIEWELDWQKTTIVWEKQSDVFQEIWDRDVTDDFYKYKADLERTLEDIENEKSEIEYLKRSWASKERIEDKMVWLADYERALEWKRELLATVTMKEELKIKTFEEFKADKNNKVEWIPEDELKRQYENHIEYTKNLQELIWDKEVWIWKYKYNLNRKDAQPRLTREEINRAIEEWKDQILFPTGKSIAYYEWWLDLNGKSESAKIVDADVWDEVEMYWEMYTKLDEVDWKTILWEVDDEYALKPWIRDYFFWEKERIYEEYSDMMDKVIAKPDDLYYVEWINKPEDLITATDEQFNAFKKFNSVHNVLWDYELWDFGKLRDYDKWYDELDEIEATERIPSEWIDDYEEYMKDISNDNFYINRDKEQVYELTSLQEVDSDTMLWDSYTSNTSAEDLKGTDFQIIADEAEEVTWDSDSVGTMKYYQDILPKELKTEAKKAWLKVDKDLYYDKLWLEYYRIDLSK